MTITKKYAKKLIKNNVAKYEGNCINNGIEYAIITRYDLQRVDHVELRENTIDPVVNDNAFIHSF